MYESEQAAKRWDWDDLRFVLAVARAGSLSGAARLLDTSHPTVFRRIAAIEGRIGQALFERQRTGYLPTQAGSTAISVAEGIANEIGDLDLVLAGDSHIAVADTIRITSSDTIYYSVLARLLVRFRLEYPGVHFEVAIGNSIVDLSRGDTDVAFRAAPRSVANLHGIHLAHLKLIPHCHRDHPAAQAGRFRPRDHEWIGFDETMTLTGLARLLRENRLEDRIVMRVNSLQAACEAVRRNFAIGVIPVYANDPEKVLVRLDDSELEIRTDLWLVSTKLAQHRPAVRSFFEFMTAEFAALGDFLQS